MKIEYKKISELKQYEKNPRKNEKAVDAVANSIKEFGFKNPIIIDKNNVIIAGHTRYKASKQLGLEEVPVILADDLTEEQVKAFRVADNSTAQIAEWDIELLDYEIKGIDMDMSQFGLWEQLEKIDAMIDSGIEPEEDNYEIEEIETIVQPGGVWQLGKHRLMCGDSTSESDMEKLMAGETVRLYLTDPPYNVNYESSDGKSIQNDNMDEAMFSEFIDSAFKRAGAVMEAGAAYYIWHADNEDQTFKKMAYKHLGAVRQTLIWNKSNFTLGRSDYHWKHEPCLYGWKEGASHFFINDRTKSTVIDEEKKDYDKMSKKEIIEIIKKITEEAETTVINEDKPSRNAEHPTMKPIKLLARQIKNSSRIGDNVLDNFGGSGSTLIACEQLNRKCFVMELDPVYATVIVDRWEKYTGEKAVLVEL